MSDEWGFADIYAMDSEPSKQTGALEDVKGDDWRNILVLGRATDSGVYPETLALVGRARYLADELGCRVEVLLIGKNLEAAKQALKSYPINNVYCVDAPDYAPIDHTAKILEQVVRKRRPELVLVFQSRTGDAVTAFAANRLGVGFVLGATDISIDTYERRAIVRHTAVNEGFEISTEMQNYPQFVSVQRGLFRAPMEDPYANVAMHDLEVKTGEPADIQVLDKRPPPEPTLETAEYVVLVGAYVNTQEKVDAARRLADKLGAVLGVSQSVVEQGLADRELQISGRDRHVAPRLLVAVGVRGGLDIFEGIDGNPLICAVGSHPDDPIANHAAYLVPGEVIEAVESVLSSL